MSKESVAIMPSNRKGYHQGIRVARTICHHPSAPRRQCQSHLCHFPEKDQPYASHATHQSLLAAQASPLLHDDTFTSNTPTTARQPSIERRHQRENQMLIRQYILGSTALQFPFSAVPNITQKPKARKLCKSNFCGRDCECRASRIERAPVALL